MIDTYAIKDTAGMPPEELAARTDVATKLIASGLPLHEALAIAQLGETVIPLAIPQDVRLRLVKEVKASVTETVERVLRELQEEAEEPITQDQTQDGQVVQPVPDDHSDKILPSIEAKPAGDAAGTTPRVNKPDPQKTAKSSQAKRGNR